MINSIISSLLNDVVSGIIPAQFNNAPQTLILIGDSITAASSTNSKDNGSSYTITAITQANPAVVTEGTSSYTAVAGEEVYLWGINGMTQLNNTAQIVTGAPTGTTIPLNVNATGFGAFVSQGKIFPRDNAVMSQLAQGFVSPMNMMLGQRFSWSHEYNRGIGGNSTAEINTRQARDLAGLAGSIVVYMAGTNDATAGTSAATIQANITSTITYVTVTLGLKMVLGTLPPRDTDTSGQKDVRDTVNAWIRTQGSSSVMIWDYYDAVANGSRNWKAGYAYDGVHPAPIGGFVMGQKLRDALYPIYGRGAGFVTNAGNLMTNPLMTGTGGSAGSAVITNNGIATSWTMESAGTGLAATRTVSKSAEGYQRFDVGYGSGLTTGERLSIRQDTAAPAVGTYYVMEALVRLNSYSGTGALYEVSAELRNNASAFGFDHSRRSNDPLATTEMISEGWLHLKTPPVRYLTGWTALRPRLNLTAKCDTGTVNAQLDIAGIQVYAV